MPPGIIAPEHQAPPADDIAAAHYFDHIRADGIATDEHISAA
ncbi:hypothetical protein AB0N62_40730 [Streptomyces sp. NPDC093982]